MICQTLLINKSASLKFLDMVCGVRSSQDIDEEDVEERLQRYKCEIRLSQTLSMLLYNRRVKNRMDRTKMKHKVVTMSVIAWQ